MMTAPHYDAGDQPAHDTHRLYAACDAMEAGEPPPIERLIWGMADYPAVLAVRRPPLPALWVQGAARLLNRPALAISGARRATVTGLDAARAIARAAVGAGLVVVTGGAAGVDLEAHAAALAAGGTAIIVLPKGHRVGRRALPATWRWYWDRVAIVSQYEAITPFAAWRALERNKIIVTLSDAVVAIDAGATGGTIQTGRQAIAQHRPLGIPASVHAQYTTGERELLRYGAQLLYCQPPDEPVDLTPLRRGA